MLLPHRALSSTFSLVTSGAGSWSSRPLGMLMIVESWSVGPALKVFLRGGLGVVQRVLGVEVGGLGDGGVDLALADGVQLLRDAVVGDDADVALLPGRLEQALLLEQGQRRLQEDTARLHVDAVQVGVLGEQALQLGGGDVALPVGGQLEDRDAGELLLHARRERLGAVAAVDGVQGALELGDLALAAQLLAQELAGLGAVRLVVGADDHVDVALVGAGVHADHGDLLAGQGVEGGGDGAGVLWRHDDGLGPGVLEDLDVGDELGDVVLRVAPRQRVQAVVLDALLDVLRVGVPEVGVRARQVDADGGLVVAGAGGGAGAAAVASGGERGRDENGRGDRGGGARAGGLHAVFSLSG